MADGGEQDRLSRLSQDEDVSHFRRQPNAFRDVPFSLQLQVCMS